MGLELELLENCNLENLKVMETINSNLLLNIIDSGLLATVKTTKYGNVYENEKQFLVTLYNSLNKEKNFMNVIYDYPKDRSYGRIYPENSLSLCRIRRPIRHLLCLDNYIDIDIVNCHPVLLLQQLKKNNVVCPFLEEYVNNRDKYLNELMKTYKISRDESKKIFLKLMYGGNTKYKNNFITKLKKELDTNTQIIKKENPNMFNECENLKGENSYNLDGSFLSIYCQELEKRVLMEMYNYLSINRFIEKNIVLCFDGCMIPKQELPINFLEKMENYIMKNSEFKVKLTIKPFDEPLKIKIVDLDIKIDNPENITDENKLFLDSLSGIDYDIANLFYETNKHLFICAQETPRPIWFMYDNGIWERIEGAAIIRKTIEIKLLEIYNKKIDELKSKNKEKNTKQQTIEYNKNQIKKMKSIIGWNIKTFKNLTEIFHQLTKFFKDGNFISKIDSNPEIICFGEDLFDLKTCEWRKTLPTDFCTLKCGVRRNDLNNTHEILLRKILLDIFTTDERTEYMINCFSMFLNGCNPGQTFNIWLGGGANGKSLLETYFQYAFGDYFCELPTTLITHEESGPESASPTLCLGRGRRIAFMAEPTQGKKANNSLLKRWSGGEKISCRALYENPSQYSVFFKLVLLCNLTFELQDITDDSIPRRVEYVNFKTKFDSNPQFDFQKLKVEEYMSIDFCNMIKGTFMNMLINNYIKLKETNYKFNKPLDMTRDKDEYLNSNDDIKVFTSTELIKTDNSNDVITLKELFRHFLNYSKNNNMKVNIKEKTFKERINRIIPFKERHVAIENGKRIFLRSVFTNIKLNEEDPFIEE